MLVLLQEWLGGVFFVCVYSSAQSACVLLYSTIATQWLAQCLTHHAFVCAALGAVASR
jgi:hypothetical protein